MVRWISHLPARPWVAPSSQCSPFPTSPCGEINVMRHASGRLWYEGPGNAIGYAMHGSHSHSAVIRVYDGAGNVIETHEHKGGFREP